MKLRAYITEWWREERVSHTHTIPGMKVIVVRQKYIYRFLTICYDTKATRSDLLYMLTNKTVMSVYQQGRTSFDPFS